MSYELRFLGFPTAHCSLLTAHCSWLYPNLQPPLLSTPCNLIEGLGATGLPIIQEVREMNALDLAGAQETRLNMRD